VDAAGDLTQLVQRAGRLGDGVVELRAELARQRGLRQAQPQRQGDKPLLGAVVQIPLDPAAGLVRSCDDPRP